LPPKPDEIPESATNNLRHDDTSEEPLYLSVKSLKTSRDDQDDNIEMRETEREDPKPEGRRTKEIFEHKVNQHIVINATQVFLISLANPNDFNCIILINRIINKLIYFCTV